MDVKYTKNEDEKVRRRNFIDIIKNAQNFKKNQFELFGKTEFD